MFRVDNNSDISEEEYEKYFRPFINKVDNYIQEEIAPLVCAYIIATGYRLDALYYNSFDKQLEDGLICFNQEITLDKKFKEKVKNILYDTYNLTIISENPLKFKEENIWLEKI